MSLFQIGTIKRKFILDVSELIIQMTKIAMYALTGCLAATFVAGSAEAADYTARTPSDLEDIAYQNQVYNRSGTIYNNGADGFNAYSTNRHEINTGNHYNNGTYRTRALTDNNDRGFDWGWLGLLGLLGLAGMRSRSRERDRA
ncbi:WGxxGxxG family protein [Paenibacillus kobensis]|uniref:WGxxGxxG family protein n=1 Tax=Paenibacillus kobensis TaxID=59841 RepID=UPI000FDB82AB|nr:WGxxGxxG family protein [Paenibacillus kobensis]